MGLLRDLAQVNLCKKPFGILEFRALPARPHVLTSRAPALTPIIMPHAQRTRFSTWLSPWLTAIACLVSLLGTTPALAEEYLAAEPMTGKKVRIDGMLRDWPGGFAKLRGKTKPGGEALLGYDDTYLYLAASLEDAKVVRTASGGQTEDRLMLDVLVPSASGKGSSTHTISVYPGDPGKLPALVKVDGKTVSQAEAVEAQSGKTLIIEAKLPWSALPGTAKVRVGLRGRLSYQDAQSPGSVRATYSTSSQTGSSMPPLTLEPETGLAQALLEPKELGFRPAREAFGDIAGDDRIERVALFGHFLTIVGSGYKGGKEFYYNELDVGSADRISRLELVDFSGDGKAEIVLQKRLGPDDSYRDVLTVLTIGKDGAPLLVFAHEVALVTPEGAVKNEVRISGSGKNAKIRIAQGKSNGFEPGSFREPTIGGGIQSALLPWESVESRSFQWQGAGLAQVEEKLGTPRMKASKTRPQPSGPAAPAPPPPRPPSASEMLDRVYALYRKDRGVGAHKPRFDLVTDVVEDARNERVLVHDRDLVVFGPGFREGQTYTYLTIGVKDAKDILSVTTRDLVGDGKAAIVVHAILRAQASKQLGGDEVERQALFVYKVQDGALARIFAAETGRASKGNRVLGAALFVPTGRGVTIELRPLRSIGWTERSYPFPEDTTAAGGLEPLLLPWSSGASRRYVFRSGAFVPE